MITEADRLLNLKGYVTISSVDPKTGKEIIEDVQEFNAQNLILNLMREWLPRLLAPKIITGRPDNSEGDLTWRDRRIALIGFGVGDGAETNPTVKPEDPEDGRSILIGEPAYPNSKLGLQAPIRRIPLTTTGPSEINRPVGYGDPVNEDIDGFYLLKEVEPDGVTITQTPSGGSSIEFKFVIGEDEYIGNIMEYCLYLGGGDPLDNSTYDIGDGSLEVARLSRNNAIPVARKTRSAPLQSLRGESKILRWRIDT